MEQNRDQNKNLCPEPTDSPQTNQQHIGGKTVSSINDAEKSGSHHCAKEIIISGKLSILSFTI